MAKIKAARIEVFSILEHSERWRERLLMWDQSVLKDLNRDQRVLLGSDGGRVGPEKAVSCVTSLDQFKDTLLRR